LRALCDIEGLGGDVRVMQANVASEADMTFVRRSIYNKYGTLDGVIYGAGLTSLHPSISVDSVSNCEAHFDAKAHGLLVLEKVFHDCNLDFCVVLSSLSTVLGGLGHLAYSSANHFSDAFIASRNRSRARIWNILNWDAWQFNGEGQGSAAMRAMLSRHAMKPDEGCKALDTFLNSPWPSRVVISNGELYSRIADWTGSRFVHELDEPVAEMHARPNLRSDYIQPEGHVEQRVAQIWQNALGVNRVGRDDDFFELGGHSLLATRIVSQLRDIFSVDFPLELAFQATTVRETAEIIDNQLKKKVESLSDDEAEGLLIKH
jgi:acyl carrier protein